MAHSRGWGDRLRAAREETRQEAQRRAAAEQEAFQAKRRRMNNEEGLINFKLLEAGKAPEEKESSDVTKCQLHIPKRAH